MCSAPFVCVVCVGIWVSGLRLVVLLFVVCEKNDRKKVMESEINLCLFLVYSLNSLHNLFVSRFTSISWLLHSKERNVGTHSTLSFRGIQL